ncbi:MAG TPA: ProQ/FinO family protein [Gammaproteobacteria bacterium]|nr:ProQ/FinO family protein [Gammaproteobacteria bacterium]
MSNLSLKEQLKALSPGLSSSGESPDQNKRKKPPHAAQPNEKKTKQKPAWLEQAQYGVELLKAWFPHCFKELKDIQPLKVGIKQDLVKYLSTCENIVVADKACMVNSLSYYVNSVAYHKGMIAGAMRIDLEGKEAGTVTAEEANYSNECRKTKLQKKTTKA